MATVADITTWKTRQTALSGLLQKTEARLEVLQEQRTKLLTELSQHGVTPETLDAKKTEIEKEIAALTESIVTQLKAIAETLAGTGLEMPPELQVMLNASTTAKS